MIDGSEFSPFIFANQSLMYIQAIDPNLHDVHIFKGLLARCDSFCLFWHFIEHTFIQYIHPSPFDKVPLHLLIAGHCVQLSERNLPGVPSRQSNSGLPNSKPAELPRTLYSGMTGRLDARIRKCHIVAYILPKVPNQPWARMFKRLWSPGIDSKEWIPLAYAAWRAGTITLFLLGA
jgi:hypothetical protein